ncbi:MAG: M14 family metallopeptidase [Bacteroidales bacterium]|nr:M14 family metallopeptidase [Bacteroidales bacterium]
MIRIVSLVFMLHFSMMLTSQSQDEWMTYYERSLGMETPRYTETIDYAKRLASASSWVTYTTFGTSLQGRDLPLLILDRDGYSSPVQIRAAGRIVLFIEACIHPGESEGKDAGLMLFRDIAINKTDTHLLNHVSILFIPVFNVDGHERFSAYNRINQNGPKEMGWRCTANNLNLNRDFLKADAPEMRQWLTLYNRWLPEFFMDIHTTNGADYQYTITYAAEVFGNMDESLSRWLDSSYVPYVVETMEQEGVLMFPYVSFRQWHDPRSGLCSRTATPRYSVGYAATRNRPGLLVETHMLKPYKVRVEATCKLIINTLRYLNMYHNTVKRLVDKADKKCIFGDLSGKPFPLRYELSSNDSIMLAFKGYKYREVKSDITGSKYFIYSDTPHTFMIPWFKENLVVESVMLPEAYIIPPEWGEVINVLNWHGVVMDTIENDSLFSITSYRFSQPHWHNKPYEGRIMINKFSVTTIYENRMFPAGSVIVPVSQQAARVIIHALEPESPDALIRWGFFNAIFEQKEYAEMYVMAEIAPLLLEDDPALMKAFMGFNEEVKNEKNRSWLISNWFYERSPWYDEQKERYPIGRIEW